MSKGLIQTVYKFSLQLKELLKNVLKNIFFILKFMIYYIIITIPIFLLTTILPFPYSLIIYFVLIIALASVLVIYPEWFYKKMFTFYSQKNEHSSEAISSLKIKIAELHTVASVTTKKLKINTPISIFTVNSYLFPDAYLIKNIHQTHLVINEKLINKLDSRVLVTLITLLIVRSRSKFLLLREIIVLLVSLENHCLLRFRNLLKKIFRRQLPRSITDIFDILMIFVGYIFIEIIITSIEDKKRHLIYDKIVLQITNDPYSLTQLVLQTIDFPSLPSGIPLLLYNCFSLVPTNYPNDLGSSTLLSPRTPLSWGASRYLELLK
ncbi:MAG: hypothetical protein HQK53_15580 [Oligoflexia bacterium]|nr:hypothetical protein [Oligoflexia bacterium]